MATTVLAGFNELLARQRLTDNQIQTAQVRQRGIIDFFNRTFRMDQPAFAVGSYARQTICAGQRDIDFMAPMSTSELPQPPDSSRFLYRVRDALNSGYQTTTVSSKRVAVSTDFTVIKVDVVPCITRPGGGYLMPDGAGGWMATNPLAHMQLIHDADTAQNHRLRPLVKMLKAWNLANGRHLQSFHIEAMVERMWRGVAIADWPAAVASTIKTTPTWLASPFPDPWPYGKPLDASLSYIERTQAIRLLESDAATAEQAEVYRAAGNHRAAIERWGVVYRGTFPAYG